MSLRFLLAHVSLDAQSVDQLRRNSLKLLLIQK
jgi:hypothetical protein